MHLGENLCENTKSWGITGMHIDAGLRFSMNFGKKRYQEISCNVLVLVLGCPCSQEIKFSKILVAQNLVT